MQRRGVILNVCIDFLEKGPLPADIVKAVDEVWAQIKSDAPKYHL